MYVTALGLLHCFCHSVKLLHVALFNFPLSVRNTCGDCILSVTREPVISLPMEVVSIHGFSNSSILSSQSVRWQGRMAVWTG